MPDDLAISFMAEEERFELSRRTSRPTVFKTAAFNRSATPPSKRYLTRNNHPVPNGSLPPR